MILPKEDKYYGTKETMREQIIHLLGGRVAEMLTLDDISTGASNDIMRATEIAKDMVTKYGFSEKLGPVNYSSSDEVFLGKDFSTRKNYSEETASEIDEEVKAIIEEAFQAARTILTEHLEELKLVAEGLLEVETLDNRQFEQLYNREKTPEQLAEDLKEELERKKEKDKKEAAESRKMRKREAELERERMLEEAMAVADEENRKGKKRKLRTTVMTYDDVTKTAKPVDPESLSGRHEDEAVDPADDDEVRDPYFDDDDDMPTEEELAVYDTDYLNDDEDEAGEETCDEDEDEAGENDKDKEENDR